jgi:hypothetical protein
MRNSDEFQDGRKDVEGEKEKESGNFWTFFLPTLP